MARLGSWIHHPKSVNLIILLSNSRIFSGFKSLCKTPFYCINFIKLVYWNIIFLTSSSLNYNLFLVDMVLLLNFCFKDIFFLLYNCFYNELCVDYSKT